MNAIIFGVPGVGKSSVVEKAAQRCNLQRIVWGDIVEKIAIGKNMVKNRDSIRKLNRSQQKYLQRLVVNDLSLLCRDRDTVIETHAVIKTKSGFLPGLNFEFLKILKPDLLVVIEADVRDILKRRKRDQTRRRDDDKNSEEIQLHMELTRQFAVSFASVTGAIMSIIRNEEGKIDETVNELAKIMKSI